MNEIKYYLLSNRPVFQPVSGRFKGKTFKHGIGYPEVPEQYKDFFIPRGDRDEEEVVNAE